ncbi:MAG: helix-turn-helix transcriptional regulator [Desulfitobacterium hafniense]|nr:helix-turn-helix transcriptional regulator [Desulfitobacterium hafniense]
MVKTTNHSPLTPEEAAQILKISKYTLYELIKRGEIPARRIGKKIRIDYDTLKQYLQGTQVITEEKNEQGHTLNSDVSLSQGLRFVGSHEPIVGLLCEFLTHSPSPVQLSALFKGSMDGLIALYRRDADITGIHLWDEQSEEYNLPFVRYVLPGESVSVVNLVQRVQGWIVPNGNPLKLNSWEDITNEGICFINRQKGSGTRLHLDSYLRKFKISPGLIQGYEIEETTHSGVALKIASGQANAGIGIQSAAQRMGLDFIPLFKERYDLVLRQEITQSMEWQQVLSILQSPAFHRAIEQQIGYETSLTGQVIF